MMTTSILRQKIKQVTSEPVRLSEYRKEWPSLFQLEKQHLLNCLPSGIINRIEHFGSTAIPGMVAKPIIDMLVEVNSLELTKQKIAPILEDQGYEYFWRPSWGDDQPPFYAWFIKRNNKGERTHHIHMVEAYFDHWDRLLFRDYLIECPQLAEEYRKLKIKLCRDYKNDRIVYTEGKTEFISKITEEAKSYFRNKLKP
jgi:GrpB-like predicted nucleotidyltransferase (UPF0157 family)